jgi:hypothetical protein
MLRSVRPLSTARGRVLNMTPHAHSEPHVINEGDDSFTSQVFVGESTPHAASGYAWVSHGEQSGDQSVTPQFLEAANKTWKRMALAAACKKQLASGKHTQT